MVDETKEAKAHLALLQKVKRNLKEKIRDHTQSATENKNIQENIDMVIPTARAKKYKALKLVYQDYLKEWLKGSEVARSNTNCLYLRDSIKDFGKLRKSTAK